MSGNESAPPPRPTMPDAGREVVEVEPVRNPPPARWPAPEFVTPDMEGPMPRSLLPCGCHLRRPDYEAVLCPEHLADLNHGSPEE